MISPTRSEKGTSPGMGAGQALLASIGPGWRAPGCSCRRRQVADADQVVDRGREGEHPAHPPHAPMPGLPEQRDRLEPAEDLFHALPALLADEVPGMSGGPLIERTRPGSRVLRDVRGDRVSAQ